MKIIMDKAALLDALRHKREQWDALLATIPVARLTEPGVVGEWSIKDIIAHVAIFELWAADQIDGLLRGATTAVPSLFTPPEAEGLDVDQENEVIFQANRSRSLAAIQAQAQQAFQRVTAAVAALPADAIMERERYTWTGGRPLWDAIAGNTYDHYDEHIPPIAAWLQSQHNSEEQR